MILKKPKKSNTAYLWKNDGKLYQKEANKDAIWKNHYGVNLFVYGTDLGAQKNDGRILISLDDDASIGGQGTVQTYVNVDSWEDAIEMASSSEDS